MNPPKRLRPENLSNWSYWLILVAGLATGFLFVQRIGNGGLAYLPVYGNFRLAMAHLAFSLPLSLWLGCRMLRNVCFPWQKILIASLATGLAIGSTTWLSEYLHEASAGGIFRWLARTVLSIVLLTLWSWASPLRPASQPLRAPVWQFLLLMVMPSLYLFHTEPILRENFRQSSEAFRVAKALEEVRILYEIVGKVPLEKRDTQAWRSHLVRKKKELEKQCSTDLSAGASIEERKERAIHLLSLGRNDEAWQTLDATSEDQELLLLRAIALREAKQWNELRSCCERIVKLNRNSPTMDKLFYDLHAESLAAKGLFREAISVYESALAQGSNQRGWMHLEIAKLWRRIGEHSASAAHLKNAIQFDPSLSSIVKRLQRSQLVHQCHVPSPSEISLRPSKPVTTGMEQ